MEAGLGRSSRECGEKAIAGRWRTGNVESGGGTPGAPWSIPHSGRSAAGKCTDNEYMRNALQHVHAGKGSLLGKLIMSLSPHSAAVSPPVF